MIKKYLVFSLILFSSFLSPFAQEPNSKNNSKKNNSPFQDPMREKMLLWSRQLGVTCVHCHNLENFKDGSHPNYQKGALHQKSTLILQQEIFNERDNTQKLKVPVDCYFCHRGKAQPEFKEPPPVIEQ